MIDGCAESAHILVVVLGKAPQECRTEDGAAIEEVCQIEDLRWLLGKGVDLDVAAVVHDAYAAAEAHLVIGSNCLCACQHEVVLSLEVALEVKAAVGRVVAHYVGAIGVVAGLVDGRPQHHPVAKGVETGLGILAEQVGHVFVEPTTLAGNRERQVVVEEGHRRLHAPLQAVVDHAIVEVDSLSVDLARPVRHYAGPGYREAEGVLAAPGQQVNVLFVAMVEVTRDIAIDIVDVERTLVVEVVPLRLALSTLLPCAFALVGGGSGAPKELAPAPNVLNPSHRDPFSRSPCCRGQSNKQAEGPVVHNLNHAGCNVCVCRTLFGGGVIDVRK